MKAVILAGGQEFGQCPLSRQLPRALWPLFDRPLIHHLVDALKTAGVSDMAVSANGRTHEIQQRIGRRPVSDVAIHYSEDALPRGAAGCIKDCQGWLDGASFLVAHGASLFIDVDLEHLLAEHRRRGAALTIASEAAHGRPARPTGLYVCEPAILPHIPLRGYHDIKEQLIPRLLQHGLPVAAVPLQGRIVPIRDEESYLNEVLQLLQDPAARQPFTQGLDAPVDPGVWIDPTTAVHARARLVAPVYVGPRVHIAAGATIIGPAVIGPDVRLGPDAVVHEAILWAGARVGAAARVEQALMAGGAAIEPAARARAAIILDGGSARGGADLSDGGFAPASEPGAGSWWRRTLARLRPMPLQALELSAQD